MTKHDADVDHLEITCGTCGLRVTTRFDGQPITKADYSWARAAADLHTRTGTTRF